MGKREDDLAAELAAQVAAGQDPFGDDDDLIVADDTTEEVTAEADDDTAVEPTEPTAEELAEQETEAATTEADEPVAEVTPEVTPEVEPEPEAAPSRPTYQPNDPSDLKAQRKALRQQEIEVEAKWAAGELDDAARAEKLSELRDQADELLVKITTSETLRVANEQQSANEQRTVISSLKAQGLKQGIDYNDTKVAKQFDTALQVLAADDDNAGLSFAQLAAKAHNTVMAVRGISKAQGATKPAESRTAPKPPVTLRNMPAAATQNVGSTLASTMSRLKGTAYTAAYAKLTPKQRAELTDD